MKLLRLLIPYLIISCFFSCKKSDELPVSTGTTYFRSSIEPGLIRVFNSGGEITDPTIISQFASDDKYYFDYITIPGNNNGTGLIDSIVFADPIHAVVSSNYQSFSCNVAYQFPLFIFNRMDTSYATTYEETLKNQIDYYIGKIKPQVFYENIISSTANNYVFAHTGIEKFVAIREDNHLAAPLLQFSVHSGPASNSNFSFHRINNTLQPDFFLLLPAGDIIVLSEYRVLYNKR